MNTRVINRELFESIMKDENIKTIFPDGDNALVGLNIIAKYITKRVLCSASHDCIYSVDVDEILDAGITEQDVRKLKEINWMMDECGCLACFV